MRILIFGASGMLGHKLYQRLSRDFDAFATIRGDFASVGSFKIFEPKRIVEFVAVEDSESVRRAITDQRPAGVINAVGIIKQAPESVDPLAVLRVNSVFPRQLEHLSNEFNFRLITISTDCVYAGTRGGYSEADELDAVDLYGISKLLGEVDTERALTIRTSLIGRELSTTQSIVEWFLAHRGGSVKGFPNAIYSGFPTIVFADIVADLIANHPSVQGVWNISTDPISKLDLLRLLNKHFDADIEIVPDESIVIDRSLDSRRFRDAINYLPESWDAMIERMAADPTPYDEWRK